MSSNFKSSKTRKVFVFLPCSRNKCARFAPAVPRTSMRNFLSGRQWSDLQSARAGIWRIGGTIRPHGAHTIGLYLYHGYFWQPINSIRARLSTQTQANRLQPFIVSGGYGVLHGNEDCQDYNALLSGPVAAFWKRTGLADIIADTLISNSIPPDEVYGYFPRTTKYSQFFRNAIRIARRLGWSGHAGCFINTNGIRNACLNPLGHTFVNHYHNGFAYGWNPPAPINGINIIFLPL